MLVTLSTVRPKSALSSEKGRISQSCERDSKVLSGIAICTCHRAREGRVVLCVVSLCALTSAEGRHRLDHWLVIIIRRIILEFLELVERPFDRVG